MEEVVVLMSLYFLNSTSSESKILCGKWKEMLHETQLTAFQVQHTLLFIHGVLGQVHITRHR